MHRFGPDAVITFLSDFGTDDEFVGVCHAVIARIAPTAHVIDLGHGHAGVRAAAAALAQAVPYCPAGAVHLVVVDPGVGTARRAVVVETRSARFVGPDNGVLGDAVDVLGGAVGVFEATSGDHRLHPVSRTFHGRDVFAPAAAFLASGVLPHELGPALDPDALVRLPPPGVDVAPGHLEADVLRADGFGNVQLAARRGDLDRAAFGDAVRVRSASGQHDATIGSTFADVGEGGIVVHVDSSGHVAVAVRGDSAWTRLGAPTWVRIEGAPGGD